MPRKSPARRSPGRSPADHPKTRIERRVKERVTTGQSSESIGSLRFGEGGTMDAAGALSETLVFLDHFQSLPDPRQRGKVIYPLDEVLLLCLVAVLAGGGGVLGSAPLRPKKSGPLRPGPPVFPGKAPPPPPSPATF